MPQIGTLLTGAGNPTVIAGQNQLDQYLLLGDVDTANPLQGLRVDVGGQTIFNIDNAATLLTALSKWMTEFAGTSVGVLFKLSTGIIKGNTTYRLINAGATTPAIFAFSEASNGTPLFTIAQQINQLSTLEFEKFFALFIQTPANVSGIEVEFTDGTVQTWVPAEADAFFALFNQAETDGRLGGVTVIDNTEQKFSRVKITTNNTGACVVASVKMADDVFQSMKR